MGGLVGARSAQDLAVARADDLQPDRQPLGVNPHGTLAAGCCVRLKG